MNDPIDDLIRKGLPEETLPPGFEARFRDRLSRRAGRWFQPFSFALGAAATAAIFLVLVPFAPPGRHPGAVVRRAAPPAADFEEILDLLADIDLLAGKEQS